MDATPRSLVDRMIGAARLDVATYEEVEHDPGATGQAAAVVAMVAVAEALGSLGGGPVSLVGAAVGALVGWLVWAGITYVVGDKLLGGTATWGEVLRTLGFAQSPGVLAVLGIVPLLGWIVGPVVVLWTVVAGFIALRQALDVGFGRTLLTLVLGGVALAFLRLIF